MTCPPKNSLRDAWFSSRGHLGMPLTTCAISSCRAAVETCSGHNMPPFRRRRDCCREHQHKNQLRDPGCGCECTHSESPRAHWPLLLSLPTSGPPHSLKLSEVRKSSLVLQWEPPVYSGRTPVTGYFVDLKEASAKDDQWRGLNEAAIGNKYLRVRGCPVIYSMPFLSKEESY